MAVGKPDFDLNSFGVKYLSKDQVQNFLEIKKRKDMGDVGKDPDTPGLEGKEVSTNEITGHKTVRPPPVKRGGFKGRSMRRVDPKTGEQIKVGQTEEETTPPEGQVQTSRLNDVQFGKLGEESASEVRESFDYHTNSPEWQEAINRDAALTTEQGTAKFDNADPKVQAIRDRIAARKKKKEDAAKKKKNKKKANDIIMDMNILKLDLMKDLNTISSRNVPKKERQTFQEQSTAERIGYKPFEEPDLATTPKGGKASDKIGETSTYGDGSDTDKILNPEWTPQDGYGNQPSGKAPADLKRKAAETIFKAISLKLDLMKDGIEGGGKNIPKYPRSFRSERAWDHGSQHKEGQAERERSEYDRESIVGYGGETSDNPSGRPYAKGKRPVKGVNNKPDPRIDPEDYTYDEKDEMGSTGDASSYPADPAQKRYPADSSGTTSDYMQHWDKTMGEHRQRGTEHNTHQEPSKLDSKDRGTTLPKGLKEKAAETIFKAISLKLDLMNKKDDWDKNDKKRTEINEGIKQDTNQGNYGEHDLVDLLSQVMGKKTGNIDGSRRAVQAALSGKKGKVGNTTVSMVDGEAPFGKKKIKKTG